MSPDLRAYFDEQLDYVVSRLPTRARELLDDVSMYVEDHPSPGVMRKMKVRHRSDLCGLYTGIPLTNRSVHDWGVLSDAIHIYREGIMSLATNRRGKLAEKELRRQIRVTILHELGHHHGLGEKELRELGY